MRDLNPTVPLLLATSFFAVFLCASAAPPAQAQADAPDVAGIVYVPRAPVVLMTEPSPGAASGEVAGVDDALVAYERLEGVDGPWLAVRRIGLVTAPTGETIPVMFEAPMHFVREREVVRRSPALSIDIRPPPPTPSVLTSVTWLERPTAQDFARYYPEPALDRDQEGRATLQCQVGADGLLACAVMLEEPQGWGFGEATLRLSRHFRAAPMTADGHPTAGGRVIIPVRWRLG